MLADMRRWLPPLFVLLASLGARPAAAQLVSDGDMTFPARAMALRPTGMALLRLGWMSRRSFVSIPEDDVYVDWDLPFQELEVRVPIGGVLVEAVAGSSQAIGWDRFRDDAGVAVFASNPQLGAYFIDAPAVDWRYELGGAIVIPVDAVSETDAGRVPLGPGMFVSATPYDGPTSEERAGWNAHRHRFGAVVGVARARVEYAPFAELILGAQLDLPIHVALDGSANLFPQGALEVAYRFEELLQVGVRTRLSSYAEQPLPVPGGVIRNDPHHEIGIALEPFVRLMFLRGEEAMFARFALVTPLGPAYPALGSEVGSTSSRGYLGVELALGGLY